MNNCIFCAIVAGELPATIVARDAGFVAFDDINPKAPVHILVIPERHIESIAEIGDLTDAERAAMGPFLAHVATQAGLDQSGYRISTNRGPDARQEVMHLHWHVLGGTLLSSSM